MGFWDRAREQLKNELAGKKVQKLRLEYVGGLPGFRGKHIDLRRFDDVRINKQLAQITAVNWQEQHQRSLGKAAAGAIVAGLLTGGLGAIAGAAIGGRKKDSSLAVIQADVAGRSCSITVRCDQDEYKQLAAFMA